MSNFKINTSVNECWKFASLSFSSIPIICVLTGVDNAIDNPTEEDIKGWLGRNEKSWRQIVGNTTEIVPVGIRIHGIDSKSEEMATLRRISMEAVWGAIERHAKHNIPFVVKPRESSYCIIY